MSFSHLKLSWFKSLLIVSIDDHDTLTISEIVTKALSKYENTFVAVENLITSRAFNDLWIVSIACSSDKIWFNSSGKNHCLAISCLVVSTWLAFDSESRINSDINGLSKSFFSI